MLFSLASDPLTDSLFSALQNPYVMTSACALGIVVILYGAVRYWLAVTRPDSTTPVPTPTIDRMNTTALESMTTSTADEHAATLDKIQSEPVPEDLLAAIPPEEDHPPIEQASAPPPIPAPRAEDDHDDTAGTTDRPMPR